MDSLEGIVLHSRNFGYCKVTEQRGQQLLIRFCGTDRETWYTVATVAQQRDFKWAPLPVGLRCRIPKRGECTISGASFGVNEKTRVHEYTVEFDGDAHETARLSERDLWPIPGSLTETPLTRACGLSIDSHAHYLAREGLLAALTQLHRETSGIQALATSRIDLLPHQAFVVGTVVDDPVWRYVLADEVGLGKTVEAGVIAHAMLASRPAARVLVLCPGPLVRQWLCEMHISFGGRDFHLLDLHSPNSVKWSEWTRIIASIKIATREHHDAILKSKWDLVVVDEAHHLLWNDEHYDFVSQLSEKAGGVLLLSAVPAKEREQELLRLLRLIDPARYADGTPVAENFVALYGAQSVIGRRLRILSRYLDDSQQTSRDQLQAATARLIESPVVVQDQDLAHELKLAIAAPDQATAFEHCRRVRDGAVSRFRISRRILKNRRTRLVASDLLVAVERQFTIVPYTPQAIEVETASCLSEIVRHLSEAPVSRSVLHAFFRKALPALCDPVASYEIASALQSYVAAVEPASAPTDIDGGVLLDYEEHEALLETVAAALGPHLQPALVERLASLQRAWIDEAARLPRVQALIVTVEELLRHKEFTKIVVFAGTYGTAEFLVEQLLHRYGAPAIATFRHDLSDDAKERQVTRFRLELTCSILVCDESGGEGRNFQFADALIHFDLPWSVAAIEQRIGRLDRIGRREPVRSIVLCAEDSLEAAWVQCLAEGFEVFHRSISGLEFMLRHAERKVIDQAVDEGPDGVVALIANVKFDSENERASDDADALTDAASFDVSHRYLRAVHATADARLEEWFPRYFRALSTNGAAKRVVDTRNANLQIWRLSPEDIADVRLPGLERSGDNPLRERYGTFSRVVARDRPDLEFFTTGHPLIDAVCAVARQQVQGRTFAVQLDCDSLLPEGLYVSVGMRVVPGSPDLAGAAIGRAERHLFGRRIHGLVDLATLELVQGVDEEQVIKKILIEEGTATDVRKARLVELLQPYADDWSMRLKHSVDAVRGYAALKQKERYGEADDAFQSSLAKERVAIKHAVNDEGASLEAALFAIGQSVRRSAVELDTIGIVYVA